MIARRRWWLAAGAGALALVGGGAIAARTEWNNDTASAAPVVIGCDGPSGSWVEVAGGEAIIGDDRGYPEERPAYRTRVAPFRLGATEVTNREFAAFVAATGYVTTAQQRGDSIVFVPPGPGNPALLPAHWWKIVRGADWRHPQGPDSSIAGLEDYPVVHVSLHDALAYARWKGARLPSEEEFEFAARGDGASGLAAPPPDSANTWQGPFPISDLARDGHKGVAPVGCYAANSQGAHDLIGNVWEWTISSYRPDHQRGPQAIALSDARVARGGGEDLRVIKGGSFLCAPNYCARYRPAARHAQAADETASHLGFRLAAD